MTLFKNKYRIESARLPGYDYSQYGAYFVTIVTHNRENFFGEIVNGKMLLNEIGKIVLHCWNDLPNHYENIILDEFVIMPNHVHGIIIITDKTDCNTRIPHETAEKHRRCGPRRRDRSQTCLYRTCLYTTCLYGTSLYVNNHEKTKTTWIV